MDFAVGISAVHNTGEVKKVGALVQLCPKPPLETLLGILQRLWLPEKIEMCQDTKDVSWHTCSGKNVEKLHSFHLKAVISINHQEDNIGNLCDVDHGLQFVWALDKGQALLLRCDD